MAELSQRRRSQRLTKRKLDGLVADPRASLSALLRGMVHFVTLCLESAECEVVALQNELLICQDQEEQVLKLSPSGLV